MRKYPHIKKVTDFDFLECLCHDISSFDERGIITNVLYTTKNYQLISRYYLYKHKTIISIHDRTGYTTLNENDIAEYELYEIFNYFKNDGIKYIMETLGGTLTEEIHFTGYHILGSYMQVFFRYIMRNLSSSDITACYADNIYCTTFQSTDIHNSLSVIAKHIQSDIITHLDKLTHVHNKDLSNTIKEFIRQVKDSYELFLPSVLLFPTALFDRLFTDDLQKEYNKQYQHISVVKKLLHVLTFSKTPSFTEYLIESIKPFDIQSISGILNSIESLAEDNYTLVNEYDHVNITEHKKPTPVIHTRNISLVKDHIFEINKKLVKSNKYTISYPIDIEKKVPLEFFYLFLNDYMVTSSNKLNVDILTAIFRDYLYFTHEDDGLIPSDLITYKDLVNTKHGEIDLYEHWLKNQYMSTKLSDIVKILLTNNTNPFRTRVYNKTVYCIVGSELAFDYYYKLIDLLEIKPHCILKIKKEN